MSHEKKPESATPSADPRQFTDDDGRRWSGFLMSGRYDEDRPEVVFVCEDSPSEPKRTVRLDSGADASTHWRGMEESRVRELFRDSEPAS